MNNYRDKIKKTNDIENAYNVLNSKKKGQRYQHNNSGRIYCITNLKIMKINGEWIDIIGYYLEGNPSHEYYRPIINFLQKFTIIN